MSQINPALGAPGGDLVVRRLTKVFQTGDEPVVALDGIDLEVPEGQFVGLVGASGSGKSTFLRLVDGLTAPTEGSITIGGEPVTRPGADRGFVFQQDRMLPWRTVVDNVILGLEINGVKKKVARAKARELLQIVGLGKFEQSFPGELSGGMRQRANLARAYAIEPRILLMDEPYAALDGQTREMMQSWLLDMWQERQATVLFVTHQIDEAVYLADRVVVFTSRPGRIKADITIDLPRPRTLEIKRTQAFADYVNEVWAHIEEEVKESMRLEMEHGHS